MRWIALGGILVVACGSNPSASVDGAAGDALGEDAPLSDALAPDAFAADAPEIDAPVDASVDAPAFGPVRITVYGDQVPAVNVPVVFLDADDQLVATVMTDPQGFAEAAMGLGGSVTIVLEPRRRLVSYLQVEPGDQLVYGWPPPPTPSRIINVRVPTVVTATPRYRVQTGCGLSSTVGASGVGQIRLEGACVSTDIHVNAYDTAAYADRGSFFVAGAPMPLTGTLDLTGHAYSPASALTVTVTGVPASASSVSADVAARAGQHTFLAASTAGPRAVAGADISMSTVTLIPEAPTIGADELLVRTTLRASPAPTLTTSLTQKEVVAPGAVYQVDVATVQLPSIVDVPHLDGAGAVRWTEIPGGSAQWVTAGVRVSHSGMFETVEHVVLAPYQPGTVRFPQLPPPFTALNLSSQQNPVSWLIVGNTPGDYRAFRPVAFNSTDSGQSLLRNVGDRSVVRAGPEVVPVP